MEPRPDTPHLPEVTVREPDSDLARGDDYALEDHWSHAVLAWESALASEDRDRARARLVWLANDAQAEITPNPWWAGPITIGFLAAAGATLLVLVAERQPATTSNVLAVVSWTLYAVAAVCGLFYAYQHRPRGLDISDDALMARARKAALAVESGSGTIGADSRPIG